MTIHQNHSNELIKSKKRKGFTLLELVITVVIIAVISAFAIPKIKEAMDFATGYEALSQLAVLTKAAEACYVNREGWYTHGSSGAPWCVLNPSTNNLQIDNPNDNPERNFNYEVSPAFGDVAYIRARHRDAPGVDVIQITIVKNTWFGVAPGHYKHGQGKYAGLGSSPF